MLLREICQERSSATDQGSRPLYFTAVARLVVAQGSLTVVARIMQLFQVTVYFAHHSQTFSEVLVENGILDIVFKVWTSSNIPGVAIYEHIANLRHSQDMIRVQCLVVLGALALHSPDVIAASERNQYCFSLAELDHTRILSTQMFIFFPRR